MRGSQNWGSHPSLSTPPDGAQAEARWPERALLVASLRQKWRSLLEKVPKSAIRKTAPIGSTPVQKLHQQSGGSGTGDLAQPTQALLSKPGNLRPMERCKERAKLTELSPDVCTCTVTHASDTTATTGTHRWLHRILASCLSRSW